MMKKLLIILSTCIGYVFNANAQCPPGAANTSIQIVDCTPNPCANTHTLSGRLSNIGLGTETYTVTNPAYTAYPYKLANIVNTIDSFLNPPAIIPLQQEDDTWSITQTLPFDFGFFGIGYSQCLIGSNGNINFDLVNNWTSSFNAYNFQGLTLPNPNNTLNNSINSPISDIHPFLGNGSSITWEVFGTSPCRVFVASWDSIPYYPSATCFTMRTTSQIVLYEGTNVIDINIKYKQLCPANLTNGATAHQGIQNSTGTIAYAVPGHNGGQWTDSLSTWRFTPSGLTYQWKNLNTNAIIGSTPDISVTANTVTDYELEVTLACNTSIKFKDTITIVPNPLNLSFTENVALGCEDDTIRFTNTSTGGTNYFWRFGDGQGSILTNPQHIYVNQSTYTVTLVGTVANCRDSVSKVFDLRHPINASLVTIADSFCLSNPVAGVNVLISNTSTGGGLVSTFNLSDASGTLQTVTRNNLNPVNFNIQTAGVYTISLNVVDTLGCVDSFRKVIFIDNTPFADFTISDSIICVGEPTQFRDTVPEFSKLFTWNFGDGLLETNKHNPFHNYDADGIKIVTLTATFPVCPPYVVTKTVLVNDYPSVQLGPDTSYCPELTAAINLNPNSFGTSYLWSNGKTTPSIVVSEAGKYWVEVSNNGCAAVDTIEVQRDCYINIPNSFTPNGDGLNNYFMPADLWRGISQYQMDIFNRWGEQVFTTTNINSRGWDGKFGGKDQPVGTYIYQINVLFKTGQRKTYTGNVTLLR
jgi:gliding motility-associated-like protein